MTLQETHEEKYRHIVDCIVEGVEHGRFTDSMAPILVEGVRLDLAQCLALNLISEEFYAENDLKLALHDGQSFHVGEKVDDYIIDDIRSMRTLPATGTDSQSLPREWQREEKGITPFQ